MKKYCCFINWLGVSDLGAEVKNFRDLMPADIQKMCERSDPDQILKLEEGDAYQIEFCADSEFFSIDKETNKIQINRTLYLCSDGNEVFVHDGSGEWKSFPEFFLQARIPLLQLPVKMASTKCYAYLKFIKERSNCSSRKRDSSLPIRAAGKIYSDLNLSIQAT